MVAPDDVPADHAGLFFVAGVVGLSSAKYPNAANRALMSLTRTNRPNIGDLNVVGLGPYPDPEIPDRGQVWAEAAADDRDPDVGRVERVQVPANSREPGPGPCVA